ncbi:peptidoglycan DD-metalloendopeptidase family protein [bacterium]|nr:peptidoglycan DD-metalloendopeptidase family protein [bacterium]
MRAERLLVFVWMLGLCACSHMAQLTGIQSKPKDFTPIVRFVDLKIGETAQVKLANGKTATVKLLDLKSERDSVLHGIWRSTVTVEVNGEKARLLNGNYNLPQLVGGVQIDCTATGDMAPESHEDHWELKKDARLRLWPKGSRLIEKGTFTPPLQERILAGTTWYDNILMSAQGKGKFYYHSGMDTGGVEKLCPVVAATDGLVVQLGDAHLDKKDHPPIEPRYDVIYIRDDRGWYYRYSHLSSIDPGLKLGKRVRMGRRIGYLGKEGASGGWTHLHFEIKAPTPDGGYGTQNGYAYWLESYVDQYHPAVIAVAQPRRSVRVGEGVVLDGSRSWAKKQIAKYEWTLDDGTKAQGACLPHAYSVPGSHREILKVTDIDGNFAYDIMSVLVVDAQPAAPAQASRQRPRQPSVMAFYWPTLGIKPGDPVYFSSRGNGADGYDVYDFDDGTSTVRVRSNIDTAGHAENGYAMTVHHFKKPGYYFVKVSRTDAETGRRGYHMMVVPVGIKP